MAFAARGFAVLLLLATLLGFGSCAALPGTNSLVSTDIHWALIAALTHIIQTNRDCIQVNGGWECAAHDSAKSALDLKRADADTLNYFQTNFTAEDRDESADKHTRRDGTVECDPKSTLITKPDIQSLFVEGFCDRLNGEEFRGSGVDQTMDKFGVEVYLFLATRTPDWVSAEQKS